MTFKGLAPGRQPTRLQGEGGRPWLGPSVEEMRDASAESSGLRETGPPVVGIKPGSFGRRTRDAEGTGAIASGAGAFG